MSRQLGEGDLSWECFGRHLGSSFIEVGAYEPSAMVFTLNTPLERPKLWCKADPGTLARGLKARLRGGR